jgi:hypothetical protein
MEYSEDTNGVFRRYQWGINKIPMGYSEDTNGRKTENTTSEKKSNGKNKNKTKTLHRKIEIEHHTLNTGVMNSGTPEG